MRRLVGRARTRRDSGDRGSAALELLGVMPVVAVVVLCLFQAAAAVYTTHATNQAVRDGARAASLGRSATTAIERSLPGALSAHRVTYFSGGEGVRLEVKVPRVGIFPEMQVDREAVMPRTSP